MSAEKDLQDAFRNLVGRKVETFTAIVIKIDKQKGVCTVSDGELEYTDVRLASVINDRESMFYIFPLKGSSVLVSPINEDIHQLYVEAYSEVENWQVKVGNTKIDFDAAGIIIEGNGESLKKVLNDYIDEVNKIIVVNGTSINVAATTAIKTRLNKILK